MGVGECFTEGPTYWGKMAWKGLEKVVGANFVREEVWD